MTDTIDIAKAALCYVVAGKKSEQSRVVLNGSHRTIATCDKLSEAEFIAVLINEANRGEPG